MKISNSWETKQAGYLVPGNIVWISKFHSYGFVLTKPERDEFGPSGWLNIKFLVQDKVITINCYRDTRIVYA
jgi:predicted membrane-bound spermidine synthase